MEAKCKHLGQLELRRCREISACRTPPVSRRMTPMPDTTAVRGPEGDSLGRTLKCQKLRSSTQRRTVTLLPTFSNPTTGARTSRMVESDEDDPRCSSTYPSPSW